MVRIQNTFSLKIGLINSNEYQNYIHAMRLKMVGCYTGTDFAGKLNAADKVWPILCNFVLKVNIITSYAIQRSKFTGLDGFKHGFKCFFTRNCYISFKRQFHLTILPTLHPFICWNKEKQNSSWWTVNLYYLSYDDHKTLISPALSTCSSWQLRRGGCCRPRRWWARAGRGSGPPRTCWAAARSRRRAGKWRPGQRGILNNM